MTAHIKDFIEQEFYHFHSHPELSYQEFETTKRLKEDLEKKKSAFSLVDWLWFLNIFFIIFYVKNWSFNLFNILVKNNRLIIKNKKLL